MIDFFPLGGYDENLGISDFHRFSRRYAEILKNRLPTAKEVSFVEAWPRALREGGELLSAETREAIELLRKGERLFVVKGTLLFIPFFTKEGGLILAVVAGADPVFLEKVSEDWLADIKASSECDFLLLKEARSDRGTGLLNLWNLQSLLGTEQPQASLHLLLVELLPKRMSCRYGLRHSQRCATLLLNFLQRDALLHHIGNYLFVLVLPGPPDKRSLQVERALLAYLKREGCHRVHIGSSVSDPENASQATLARGDKLLDQAWTALRQAEKRGPFSFCAYSRLIHPENHALPPAEVKSVRRMSAWARTFASFSVILFHGRDRHMDMHSLLGFALDRRKWLMDAGDLAVFLDEVDGLQARHWAEDVIGTLRERGGGGGVAAGVCAYPCGDFSKTEILFNCRKALYHASFLDGVEVVVCDAISLNLSGDVCFGEGDLARAVCEYRHGLTLDGGNINLQNSLGVTLAMMNKLVPAKTCFEKALQLDPHNFMALYNLGLAEQVRGRLDSAYGYLEGALHHFDAEDAGGEVLADLRLQLGMLAGDLGHHRRALDHLLAWKEKYGQGRHGGKVCYYLGRAYAGSAELGHAMVELQRALQFNEFDDRAMSLLGTIYLRAGEGDQIALALCRKSVELEPGNHAYRFNLAEVQIQCGLYQEARDNLRRLLPCRQWRGRAQVAMGRCSLRQGENGLAKRWFGKALAQSGLDTQYRAEALGVLDGAV